MFHLSFQISFFVKYQVLCFAVFVGVRIESRGDFFYIEYRSLRFKFDNETTWELSLEKDDRPSGDVIRGLCGNFDLDPLSKGHNLSY